MPVLIILLFYIHDLVKVKRWYSQTEFVAQQFANIIQNISQNEANRIITIPEIRQAFGLANLSMCPGYTLYSNGRLTYFSELFLTYVVGNSDGTASCKWRVNVWGGFTENPSGFGISAETKQHPASLLNFQQNTSPSKIYPSLKINPGEGKIIIESTMKFYDKDGDYTEYKAGTAKKAFGYFLYNIQPKTKDGEAGWYYHSVVIFTPKPGLFNDDIPPSSK